MIKEKCQWGDINQNEGHSSIKDTWTKPRGRVDAREGGGFGWGGEKMQTAVIEQQ